MLISVRSPGAKIVTLVVSETASALDVLRDEHLKEWPVPKFHEASAVVVKRATTGDRIFLSADVYANSPLTNLNALLPGCVLQLSWSMDGNIHIWVAYPELGETQ
mmetsp:Transcript_11845/g.14086  ORF Transcript_11845/g.14086 Transcript_11845/m.14086 type:complete len:105 (-) Transcript_11845:292-606(-)|eukprot:CAMPEP_0197852166 /NCGR_PEP_ID=MMETSP1438-20131217/19814_1 /TAXON_ID=1461541 /ORGANISM="Pterosperma sp., Strain CCMP1384" /LENGTH=104 /DNA_ID=CAMNT_0043466057 /DNA_START=420 /DNA_END=734 /DNA_ORIENTATION=+